MLTLTLNDRQLFAAAERFALTSRDLQRAQAAAVNDVAKRARNNKRRLFRAYLTLPAKSVNERVEIVKRASASNATAVVTVDRRSRGGGSGGNTRPTLMSFQGRPRVPQAEGRRTKRGRLTKSARAPFTYQITKNGSRKTLPGAFVQRATRRFNLNGGGFTGVSDQRAQAFVRKTAARFPLAVPRGPSLSAVYQSPERNNVQKEVVADLRDRLPRRLADQSRRIYERRWRRVA